MLLSTEPSFILELGLSITIMGQPCALFVYIPLSNGHNTSLLGRQQRMAYSPYAPSCPDLLRERLLNHNAKALIRLKHSG